MIFDDAIQAHTAWKIELAAYIEHPGADGEFATASLGAPRAARNLKPTVEQANFVASA